MGTSGLGSLLVEEGLLTEADRRTIKRTCGSHGSAFARSIVAMGLLDEDELAAFLAERTPWRVAPKELFRESRQDVWGLLDPPLVQRLEVLPLKLEGKTLHVAVVDPLDHDTLRQLAFFTGYKIHPVISTMTAIRASLAKLLKGYRPQSSQLEQFLTNHAGAASRHTRLADKQPPRRKAATAKTADVSAERAMAGFSSESLDDLDSGESLEVDGVDGVDGAAGASDLSDLGDLTSFGDDAPPNSGIDALVDTGVNGGMDGLEALSTPMTPGPADAAAIDAADAALDAAGFGDLTADTGGGDAGGADVGGVDFDGADSLDAGTAAASAGAGGGQETLAGLADDIEDLGGLGDDLDADLSADLSSLDADLGGTPAEAAAAPVAKADAVSDAIDGDAELGADLAQAARGGSDDPFAAVGDDPLADALDATSAGETALPDDPFSDAAADEAVAAIQAAAQSEPDPFAGLDDLQASGPTEPTVGETVASGDDDLVTGLENDLVNDLGDLGDPSDPSEELRRDPVASTAATLEAGDVGAAETLEALEMSATADLTATLETGDVDAAASLASLDAGDAAESLESLETLDMDEDLAATAAAPDAADTGGDAAPLAAAAAFNRALMSLTLAKNGVDAVQRVAGALAGAGLSRGLIVTLAAGKLTPLASWQQGAETVDVKDAKAGNLQALVTPGLTPALSRLFAGWTDFDARDKDLKPFATWVTGERALLATLLPAGEGRQLAVITAWDNATRGDATLRASALEVFRRIAQKL